MQCKHDLATVKEQQIQSPARRRSTAGHLQSTISARPTTQKEPDSLAATLRGSRPGGAIRIAHYDVTDDVITRKL